MRSLCESHSCDGEIGEQIDYKKMKQSCDEYFYLPARSEHRGVGGIFFDDMPASTQTLSFVSGVVDSWMPSWFPIIDKRQPMDYTEQQRNWQLLRRGRYLEFNLRYLEFYSKYFEKKCYFILIKDILKSVFKIS